MTTPEPTSSDSVDLGALLERHHEMLDTTSFSRCWQDGQEWPCDAFRLAADLATARAAIEGQKQHIAKVWADLEHTRQIVGAVKEGCLSGG